jgi:hypothetical protein
MFPKAVVCPWVQICVFACCLVCFYADYRFDISNYSNHFCSLASILIFRIHNLLTCCIGVPHCGLQALTESAGTLYEGTVYILMLPWSNRKFEFKNYF